MKRVLAFIGSPRSLGNCELMVKEISRHIVEPHELRLLRLSDFDIRPCRGCYACLFGDKGCVLKDEFSLVLDEILAADAYLVASPTYFLGPASVMKRLTDRWLALYPHVEKLWGRPGVAVSIAGIEGNEGYSQVGLESFLKLLLADIKASRVVYGALPGEVFSGPGNRAVAAELAASLFAERREDDSPSCPVCGGRTFRFLGAGKVRCMLCSSSGTVAADGDELLFHMRTGEHAMFVSLEAAVEHRSWLRGMKEKFLAERTQLKQITGGYVEGGTWVKPGGDSHG
ncbi:MAG: flavodoxin family protein [Deltaproteobacteria bacterium]|nr:flavodoxin family protein [Deltaproteobacteria bacterium]